MSRSRTRLKGRDPLPLDEATELVGEWWLPEQPAVTAVGRLTYTPHEQLQLDVTSGHGFYIGHDDVPIVLGLTVEGRPVTLVDVQRANFSMNAPGGVQTVANVGKAFVGMHASTKEKLRLHDLRARMSHLTEWLGVTAIDLGKLNFFPKRGPADWNTPNVVGLARVRSTLLTASFEMVGDRDGGARAHRISLEQRAWVNALPTTRSRSYDDLHGLLSDVRKYVAFAAGAEVEFLELRGETTVRVAETFGPRPARSFKQPRTVWVLYVQRDLMEGAKHAAPRMLFRYAESRFGDDRPLTRWCRRAAVLGPIYNLYLTAQPRRGLYLEFRFLAVAQALEALHARLHPKSKLELRQRLDALINDLPRGVREHVPERFLELMVHTRNYYTHWDRKKEAKAAHGDELFALVEGAKILLEVSLMTSLGFGKNDLNRLVLSNQRLVRNMQVSFQRL